MVTIEFNGFDINTYGGDELMRNLPLKDVVVPKFKNAVINNDLNVLLGDELFAVELMMDGTIIFKYIDSMFDESLWLSFTPDKYGTEAYKGDVKKIHETKYNLINAILSNNGLIAQFYNKEPQAVEQPEKEEREKDE